MYKCLSRVRRHVRSPRIVSSPDQWRGRWSDTCSEIHRMRSLLRSIVVVRVCAIGTEINCVGYFEVLHIIAVPYHG
eukprot:155085-Pyramimonas_sp.AAC.1